MKITGISINVFVKKGRYTQGYFIDLAQYLRYNLHFEYALINMNLLATILNLENLEQWINLNCDSLDKIPCFIFMKNRQGVYLNCNNKMALSTGFSKCSDLVGLSDVELCWQQDSSQFIENDQRTIKTKKSQFFMEYFADHENNQIIATTIKSPLTNNLKKSIGIIGISFIQQKPILSCMIEDLNHHKNFEKLSKRQRECLSYLSKGMSIKHIAMMLQISPRTVEEYINIIKEKLNCHTRAELIGLMHSRLS